MDAIDDILAAETPSFARAVRAIIHGDVPALQAELATGPGLIHARSGAVHRATLLHYCGANGVEAPRQRTPPNAPAIARLLLDRGAKVNATCNLYRGAATTLGLMLSSQDHHRDDRDWVGIGSGGWDYEGRASWVRLDRVLDVPEEGIRREGAILEREVFEVVATRLRAEYSWS